MNEKLNIILIILAFIILISWSVYDLLKLNKKLKSKKLSDKKEGTKNLKNYGSENILISLIDFLSTIFKKLF